MPTQKQDADLASIISVRINKIILSIISADLLPKVKPNKV